jgi:urease accessory protein UreF
MELPVEALSELQQIHCRLTGEKLSNQQASEMGRNLFRLFLAVYEPVPTQWSEETGLQLP